MKKGSHCTKETKKKMRDVKIGKNNPMYDKTGNKSPLFGRHHLIETILKISERLSGENNPNYGKHFSDEHKEKIGKANLGKKRTEEAIEKMRAVPHPFGENSKNWKGGISFESYPSEFNDALKQQIRERDDFTCQLHWKENDERKLNVHHIDYDKENNNPWNLISLCRNCHSKTGANRDSWINFFSVNLAQRGAIIKNDNYSKR